MLYCWFQVTDQPPNRPHQPKFANSFDASSYLNCFFYSQTHSQTIFIICTAVAINNSVLRGAFSVDLQLIVFLLRFCQAKYAKNNFFLGFPCHSKCIIAISVDWVTFFDWKTHRFWVAHASLVDIMPSLSFALDFSEGKWTTVCPQNRFSALIKFYFQKK